MEGTYCCFLLHFQQLSEDLRNISSRIDAKGEDSHQDFRFGAHKDNKIHYEQLDQCPCGDTIPSSQGFGSLNLSHAVQIMCYHLFRKKLEEKEGGYHGVVPVDLERIDKAVKSLTDDMQKVGFFKMPGREDMENFWRSLLSRAAVSESEVQYLEKTFTKISGLATKQ